MDEVYRGHKQEVDKLEHDIEDSQMAIVNCEASASRLEERFKFFQEMRGYVRDLVECLNEKVSTYIHVATALCLVEIFYRTIKIVLWQNLNEWFLKIL